jgi:chorismate mutase
MKRNAPPVLVQARRKIDAADAALLRVFNERAKSVLAIGAWKRRTGIAVYDPKREKAILERVARENRGPLDEETVVRLFERVIDEFRRFERLASEGAVKPKTMRKTP